MPFDSPLHTIPTQRRPYANSTDLELASMEEGTHRPRPGPSSSSAPRVLAMSGREVADIFSSTDRHGASSPSSTDDLPPLTDLLTLSTYLIPLLQKAHRSALVATFKEFLEDSYFSPSTGPIVNLVKTMLKFSSEDTDLEAMAEGKGWTIPGASEGEMNKALRKAWTKHLLTAESNGSLKRLAAEEMKDALGKIVNGKDWSSEPVMPMTSLLQTFNMHAIPFGLPVPRTFIQHLPTALSTSSSSPSSSSTIAESNSPLVTAPPPNFTPPLIADADLDQHVAIPHSFHTHATALFPYVNKDTKILSLVPGSRISVRSPMAQAPIFDLLAKSTKWLAFRGARQARELLKEVLDDAWAKTSTWREKDGWEWVNDLGSNSAHGDDPTGWRNTLANMSGTSFNPDKQKERIAVWNACWEVVRTARSEAMIAEEQGDFQASKGNQRAAISAYSDALVHDPSGRSRLLLKRATSYRASELLQQAEQDLIEVTTLPESPTLPTVAPARAMLKKVRLKIKNADKPGPNPNTLKKAKKKANQKARAALGEDAGKEEEPPMPTSTYSPKTAASMGLGLGLEIKQAAIEQAAAVEESQPMNVDVAEMKTTSVVKEKKEPTSVSAPSHRDSSTTPKPQDPPLPTVKPPVTSPTGSSNTLPSDSPSSTVIPSVASPPAAEDPTLSSSSSSTSDAFVTSSTTSNSAETMATSASDSPLTPRSEIRELSLDRTPEQLTSKPPTVPASQERTLPERRTSLVIQETDKLEIELSDEETTVSDEEVVFGRVERTVVEPPVASTSQSQGFRLPSLEPLEMEFEDGIFLMVCGQFFESQTCDDGSCIYMHELPVHSSASSSPPPPSQASFQSIPFSAASILAPSQAINSLLRSHTPSSATNVPTLDEFDEDSLLPNPGHTPSSFSSASIPIASDPVRPALPTLVFSTHNDADELSVPLSSTGQPSWAEDGRPRLLDWAAQGKTDTFGEAAKKVVEQAPVVASPAPASTPVVAEPQQQQPKKKAVKAIVEKRVVPGSALPSPPREKHEKEVASVSATMTAGTMNERWWEKGANAQRKEVKKEEWVDVPMGGKKKNGGAAKGAK